MAISYRIKTRGGRKGMHLACIKAAENSPQFSYHLLRKLKDMDDADSLIKYWSSSLTLFSSGYHVHLSDKAVATFKKNPVSVL